MGARWDVARPRTRRTGRAAERLDTRAARRWCRRHDRTTAGAVRRTGLHLEQGDGRARLCRRDRARNGHPHRAGLLGRHRRRRLRRGLLHRRRAHGRRGELRAATSAAAGHARWRSLRSATSVSARAARAAPAAARPIRGRSTRWRRVWRSGRDRWRARTSRCFASCWRRSALPVLDASHAAVCAASERRRFGAALHARRDIERALAARTREIRAAGFEPQVEDVRGLSLVFAREGSIEAANLRRATPIASPSDRAFLTPNVLLRPIVEQAILPTVAYLGGPGELAYFAQVSAVADALGVRAPVALPRWSCTLVEPHVDRLLRTFGVTAGRVGSAGCARGERRARGDERASRRRRSQALRAAIATLPDGARPRSRTAWPRCCSRGLDAITPASCRSARTPPSRRYQATRDECLRDVATLRAALYPSASGRSAR